MIVPLGFFMIPTQGFFDVGKKLYVELMAHWVQE